MSRPSISGLRLVTLIFALATNFLPDSSVAQEAQRVYEAMEGLGNSQGSTEFLSKPHDQQLSPPLAEQAKPANPLRILSTYEVTTNADTGVGSFRRGIDSANKSSDLTAITFNIGGGGVQTITLLTPLPNISFPVNIDGTTQPGFAGAPIIELNGGLVAQGFNGLTLFGGSSVVRGLVINRFRSFPGGGNGFGIIMDVNGGNVIQGNYIGLNVAGTDTLANGGVGVGIFGTSAGNTIGGTAPGERNVISGNRSSGVALSTTSGLGGNIVRGNYLGTNATGDFPLGNRGNGVFVNSPNCIIGGLVEGSRNIVSGNVLPGIFISPVALRTVVQGNYVGTDVTGSFNLGNGSNGMNVRSSDNIIGDISEIGRNIIVGSVSAGLYVFSATATRNKIINNLIGTDVSGTVAMANNKGMVLDTAPNNTIGGPTAAEGNVIAGNLNHGVDILNAAASSNKLLNNFIGTNWYGQSDLGNSSHGVKIASSQDTIRFNTIAYNSENGVFVSSGTQNLIMGNLLFSNVGMGIDLAPAGLAINDTLDADTGANNLQNFPLLDSATFVAGNLKIDGRFNGKPNTQFFLDFYLSAEAHSSHFGEGTRYLPSGYNGVTDASGFKQFTATIPLTIGDRFLTATSRDSLGNTSEFSQALDLTDTDGDGIMDAWETQGWGMDVNSDGLIDLDLWALGAHTDRKDIFVEVDAMSGMAPRDSLRKVVESFEYVPNALIGNPGGEDGINLHITISDTTIIPISWYINWWISFQALKTAYFGTQVERVSSNARFILEAKKLVYRYCVFAYEHDTGAVSGRGEDSFEQGCDDFFITLGTWIPSGGTNDQKSGTFMHELGHTLGLRHGGVDDINYKPNYISVMNYAWQIPFRWSTSGILQYSREALPTLNESALDEFVGLGVHTGSFYANSMYNVPFSGPGRGVMYAKLKANETVDWDSLTLTLGSVNADVNIYNWKEAPSPDDTLVSQSDWDKLIYNFRHSPDFTNAARLTQPPQMREMDFETFEFLNNLAPPKPTGQFVMDGVLDTSATLISTNAGINLYARYKSGQLYVATNTAQSQGGDMVIFVTDSLRALRPAPVGKTGQAAGWSVYLWNLAAGNSSGWSNSTEAAQINFTDKAVGTVLEGVIDLEFFYGKSPTNLFIGVGKYGSETGGALLAQVPAGNGNANIEPSELFQFIGTPPPPPPNTNFVQQGNKLVGSGATVGAFQGCSVSLSSDGNTAIVGGYADNNNAGAAWVYTRTGGVWAQQGSKLVGTGAAGVAVRGYSVGLSSDGNTAIIGGIGDNNSVGAAWIFVRSGGQWAQQGSKLVASDVIGAANVGASVALSSDGNTAIVGGPWDGNLSSRGAAWIFTRSGGLWSQQGSKLLGTGAVYNASHAGQGTSVALSSDGNTAIIGAPGDNALLGAAWIFTRAAGVWTQQGNKLVGTGAVGSAAQGFSVSLSSDGNTALVSGRFDNNNTGTVWVFIRSAGVWSQQGSKLVGTGAVGGAEQGFSVSLSSDGNTAIVGGQTDSSSIGGVWVYTRTGVVWNQRGNKLVGTGGVGTQRQGWAVSLSGDGNTAIVGGPGDTQSLGAAWVFTHDTPLPIQLASFTATVVNGTNVRLDWTTISETNNYGFEIQRSPNNENAYTTLPNSFIPGHGTTNEPQHYSFTDVSVLPGQWYYRLKQIDLDATVHYSDGVTISTLTGVSGSLLPDKFGLSQNFPDPFNPSTTIQYQLPKAAHVSLKIYNLLGQEIATLVDGVQDAGYKSTIWDARNAASGVYFFRIIARSDQTTFTEVRKMLMMK